ncbi:MAG: division/cell wall cluster transcriptional repressor MraZ [Dehalococcoidales bacterium]|jgi:MraZ protein|nr:division/cell wall cluster transcriptional repressor MraZ [Dehalococcoidales bacterium]
MEMFFGEFGYRMDEKGRIPLPPRFRAQLKDGLVLMPGVDNCITAYTMTEWARIAESLNTKSGVTRSKVRKLNRALFSTAFHINIDGQGRISLPVQLREHAGIDEEVIVVGANNCLELWNKVAWEDEKASSRDKVWDIIENLEENEEA